MFENNEVFSSFNKEEAVTSVLPLIPLRNIIPLNNNELRLDVARAKSLEALNVAELAYNDFVLLGVQQEMITEDPSKDDIVQYATVAKITMKIKLPNGGLKVKFKTIARAKISGYEETDKYFLCNFTTIPAYSKDKGEELALTRVVISEIIDNIDILFSDKEEIIKAVQGQGTSVHGVISTDILTDIVAFNLKIEPYKKLKYLEEAELTARLNYIIEDIETEKYIQDIESKIVSTVKKNIDENQKEYYLREKLKAIHEELGDKAKRENELEELRQKINQKVMPEDIKEKVLKELSRYEMFPSSSGESRVTRDYLDWMCELPWSEETTDEPDLNKVEASLENDHFGLDKVKDRIMEYLAVKSFTGKNPATIICFAGPPGVGKTSLAAAIAKSLGRKYVKVSLGGVKDESEIRGHRRTYLGALPGRILQAMKKAGTVNPVFLLDEIDKMSSDYKGDPASAMLEVLDPQQNKNFSDHYIEENYDLSKVLFIATANYLGNIPAPLRDRMEIIELSSYTEIEKISIAKDHLVTRQLEAHGLTADKFSLTDNAIKKIIQYYTRESGVRELERLIGTLVRKAIKKILTDNVKNVVIDENDVHDYLGKEKFSHNLKDKEDLVGVVTGLAYTQFGGDTLPVEVTYFKGKGKLTLTGKLGDVMKESALTAISFVRANAEKYGIDLTKFDESDIHVHVPDGATPKDGPSAGVTIATAIISAFTNTPVSKEVGMTGEISLRGRALPIGGVREKAISAHRSGIRKIIIPIDNVKDIEDIPVDVRKELEIIPVKELDEIIKIALVK